MRGRLSYRKWAVSSMGGDTFLGERIVDGKTESIEIRAHCLACAKAEILTRRGGEVDTRGWHNQGVCGSFLKAARIATSPDAD
jgi:hypothetical protein